MSITLNIPEDLERELATEAAQLNLPLDEYVVHALAVGRGHFLTSGAEVVSYWQQQGVIGTRPEIRDAAAHARAIRESAERRDRT